ncbi:OadG family protein [Ruminococcus sp. 210702-SL.1.03]|uniref:OadG family protein n=1 Tax=Ruminococcus sp. 210702-SL.1.03 TaxID=2883233 RepID=UPI001D060903|nr:OadG family protein [Ruminococcus sp. 210702-SL.1.03]MCB6615450.1 OadG family protein [Ruminococcus sp. 210702-SL.1.03]
MNSGLYQFADNVIHTSDKDLGAETVAAVVITGLAVVFIGLILLIALVWLYGKIFQAVNDKAAKKAAAAAAAKSEAKAEKAHAPAPAPVIEDGIEEEVAAVIAAAIAAYGAQTGKKLAVRSIRSADGGSGSRRVRNAWGAAALSEATRPF